MASCGICKTSHFWKICYERRYQIVIRLFSLMFLVLNGYDIYLKVTRGDFGYAAAALIILVFSGGVGILFSFYNLGNKDVEWDDEDSSTNSSLDRVRFVPNDYPIDEEMEEILEPSEEKITRSSPENSPEKKVRTKKGVSFGNVEKGSKKKKSKIQYRKSKGTVLIKQTGEEVIAGDQRKRSMIKHISQVLKSGWEKSSWQMKVSHLLFLPKWYHFFHTWNMLSNHFDEPLNEEAVAELQGEGVKKVSFSESWRSYCEDDMVSKELSLAVSALQAVPMIILNLVYWTTLPIGHSWTLFDNSKLNGFEVLNLVILMLVVAYRVVSVSNQRRRLQDTKEDAKFGHMVYLTFAYFLFVCSRVLVVGLVMCISTESMLLVTIVLLVRVVAIATIWYNSTSDKHLFSSIISSLLMLFLYTPPNKTQLSKHSYHGLYFFESFCMFAFGLHAIVLKSRADVVIDQSQIVNFVGFGIDTKWYGICFAIAICIHLLAILMTHEKIERRLAKYTHIGIGEINEYIRSVNQEFQLDEGNKFQSQVLYAEEFGKPQSPSIYIHYY